MAVEKHLSASFATTKARKERKGCKAKRIQLKQGNGVEGILCKKVYCAAARHIGNKKLHSGHNTTSSHLSRDLHMALP